MKIILILFVCVSTAIGYFITSSEYVRTPLGDGIDVSTMKVLKEAYKKSEDKNVVSSPLGVMILLSLYNVGAGPKAKAEITSFLDGTDAKAEITSFLGGTDAKKVTESYQQLSVLFSEMDPDVLSIANKISVGKDFTLKEDFVAAARGFHSEFDKLDFGNAEEAAARINQWAAEKTKGHITSPVNKDTFDPEPVSALFNVIFFNGHWNVPFKVEDTKEQDFQTGRGTVVKKPMMHFADSLFYKESEELGAKMIQLPYKEKGFRMMVVLPDEVNGLPSVLEKIATKGLLSEVFSQHLIERNVVLDMPKFEIRSKLNFNDILPQVGVSEIFLEDAPGIVDVPVIVSKAFQEAFIKVNEEGATAGAFTALTLINRGGGDDDILPPVKFTVDHPFLYAILYGDKIIFAGTYSE